MRICVSADCPMPSKAEFEDDHRWGSWQKTFHPDADGTIPGTTVNVSDRLRLVAASVTVPRTCNGPAGTSVRTGSSGPSARSSSLHHGCGLSLLTPNVTWLPAGHHPRSESAAPWIGPESASPGSGARSTGRRGHKPPRPAAPWNRLSAHGSSGTGPSRNSNGWEALHAPRTAFASGAWPAAWTVRKLSPVVALRKRKTGHRPQSSSPASRNGRQVGPMPPRSGDRPGPGRAR